MRVTQKCIGVVAVCALAACPALAERPAGAPAPVAHENLDGTISAAGQSFASWSDYFQSDYFHDNGLQCGAPTAEIDDLGGPAGIELAGSPSDCTFNLTNPSADYDPSVGLRIIPVVVHVIQNSSGTGFISEAMVQSQIDVLNEDFMAIEGSLGAPGTDCQLQFYLAGLDYTTNTTWFNDSGTYYNTLAWDTNVYMNIYTNTAGGFLGYVPDLPQGGIAGSNADRVVCHYQSFGRNSPGFPYHLGRTATHEIGHYFGLYHTFQSGCGTSSCYTTGDRICDTNAESSATGGCPGSKTSCGNSDPFHNYMDYSNDSCMWEFTFEQARRIRCSLEHYRPDLAETPFVPETISSAVSLVDHGGTELALDLSSNNIECRSSGAGKIQFGVTGTVSSVSTAVSCANASYGGSAGTVAAGTTVTVTLSTPLPDQDCCTLTLTGDVEDSFAVRTLAGDIDRNGSVTTGDASIIKPFFNGDPAIDGPQYDYNDDGAITTADFSQVKPLFNNAAPACP